MNELEKRLLIVVGLTCAGKGYLLQRLIDIGMKILELDMGDVLRHRKRSDPEFAKLISSDQNSGGFCSVNIVNQLADEKLEHFSKRPAVYLSGYPRTKLQLEHLFGSPILKTHQVSVVHIDTPREVCKKRALAAQRGRDDDHLDAVRRKFRDFDTETFPVIQRLKDEFRSFTFDGRYTDHKLMELVENLGLHDLIDINEVSEDIKEEFHLWKFAEEQEDAFANDIEFLGSSVYRK
ncbi:AAA family ATPase [Candidatus Parcubacteria bacterium]|nr:AAA family ATPase [Candidatus Parcubacteria bacterium]